MHIVNSHERMLPGDEAEVGALIDSVATRNAPLWPAGWPKMRLDRDLAVGARGGHGPIRYSVEAYEPGKSVRFRLSAPKGFNGTHGFVLEPRESGTLLRHVIEMDAVGPGRLAWTMVLRPLHDAMLEDVMDCAERAVTGAVLAPSRWSFGVRVLRRLLK